MGPSKKRHDHNSNRPVSGNRSYGRGDPSCSPGSGKKGKIMKKKDLKRELVEAKERIASLKTRLEQLMIKRSVGDDERPEYDQSGRRLAESIGSCPECGGRVIEFKDRFACINSTTGECSFSIDRFYLEQVMMVDAPEVLEYILIHRETTYWYEPCDPDEEEPSYEVHVKLLRADDGRWYFDYVPIEL